MLGLTNVSPAHAGNYSVVVSNFAGTVISDAAFLGVNAQTSPARLQSLSKTTNRVEFQVQGEPGNYYRIESSTNLAQWLPEMSFKDSRPFYSRYFTTSLIFASNMLSTITVPSLDPRKYYRAALYAPSNEVCNLNLKEIRLAKDMWARERKHSSTEYASVTELQVYLPQKAIPGCPTAGFYIFETVGRTPTCSSPGHILEEAW
jgi:hypothetical protein